MNCAESLLTHLLVIHMHQTSLHTCVVCVNSHRLCYISLDGYPASTQQASPLGHDDGTGTPGFHHVYHLAPHSGQ